MSIGVDPTSLETAIAEFGSGHLLSTTDGRVRAVTVDVTMSGGILHVPWSKGTAANLASNSTVTVLFPPKEHHGHTLIVDGDAQDTGAEFLVTPRKAVLYRPDSHADGPPAPDGCGNDCMHL